MRKGYYWIRLYETAKEWIVGHYSEHRQAWTMCGLGVDITPYTIGPRIEPPAGGEVQDGH